MKIQSLNLLKSWVLLIRISVIKTLANKSYLILMAIEVYFNIPGWIFKPNHFVFIF